MARAKNINPNRTCAIIWQCSLIPRLFLGTDLSKHAPEQPNIFCDTYDVSIIIGLHIVRAFIDALSFLAGSRALAWATVAQCPGKNV